MSKVYSLILIMTIIITVSMIGLKIAHNCGNIISLIIYPGLHSGDCSWVASQ